MSDLRNAAQAALAEQDVPEGGFGNMEPVGWMSMSDDGSDLLSFAKPADDPRPVPLYTAPPRRNWVGLDISDLQLLAEESDGDQTGFAVRAALKAEMLLRERNR